MNLHEYQAKRLLASYGVPVPEGRVAASADEAVAAAQALGGQVWVVKAQVHAGGRGKAGGVKLARDAQQGRAAPAACSVSGWSPSRPGPPDCRSNVSMSKPDRT